MNKFIQNLKFWDRVDPQFSEKVMQKYSGNPGREKLIQTLLKNPGIGNNPDAAKFVVKAGQLVCFERGHDFIHQNATDDDVYFLIYGEVVILAFNEEIAIRRSPHQVGEMAAMRSNADRSATVRVLSPSAVAIKISADRLQELFKKIPKVKDRMNEDLQIRARERVDAVAEKKPQPNSRFHLTLSAALSLAVGILVFTVLPGVGVWWKLVAAFLASGLVFPTLSMRQPKYRYYRLLLVVVVGILGLATTEFDLLYNGEVLGSPQLFSIVGNVPPVVYITLGLVALGLLALEFTHNHGG